MKKYISYILLALTFVAASCTKGEEEQPISLMKGMFYTGVTGVEGVTEVFPGKSKVVDVRAYADTLNGSVSDIFLTMSFKVADKAVVDAYNEANGTNYEMCPGSAYEFTSNQVMMPRYGVSSSTAKLKLSTIGLEDGVTYLLPLIIDKVNGTDNWELSANPYAYIFLKQVQVAPDAGTGTKDDPYNLYTAADLKSMVEKLGEDDVMVYFALKADIDMAGQKWVPLNYSQPYKKLIDFNGNGHTIDNFTCDWQNYPSFFGVLYGNCYDVSFTNAVIDNESGGATGIVGSYCGTTGLPGTATRVHVQGRVHSPAGNKNGTGGLFGRLCGARVIACSADVEIESDENYVGGLFGYDHGVSYVSDCWTSGSVKAVQMVGGIGGGLIKAGSEIYNCYSTAKVEGSYQLGGILGHANLDAKGNNDTNEPNDHIEGCIAWNEFIHSTATDKNEHYSNGAIVGYTAVKNFLANCFRKSDLDFLESPRNIELGYKLTDQANAGPGSPLTCSSSNTYDFAYHGKAAAAGATVSSIARNLGWSGVIWDFSGPFPVLKSASASEGDAEEYAGGQLPDYDEHEFYN